MAWIVSKPPGSREQNALRRDIAEYTEYTIVYFHVYSV